MDGMQLFVAADDSGFNDSFNIEEDNFTTSSICAARTIEAASGTIYSPTVNNILRFTLVLYYIWYLIVGVCLNSLVICLFGKFKNLRTPSFCIALQIAVIDFCLTLLVGIALIMNSSIGHWALGFQSCVFYGLILFIFYVVRTLLFFVFVLDRFSSVFLPFFYPKHSRNIIVGLSVLSWLISVSYSLTLVPGALDCYIFSEPSMICGYSIGCNKSCSIFFYFFLLTIVLPATICPVFLFLALYLKGKKNPSKSSSGYGSGREWDFKARLESIADILLTLRICFPCHHPTKYVEC